MGVLGSVDIPVLDATDTRINALEAGDTDAVDVEDTASSAFVVRLIAAMY